MRPNAFQRTTQIIKVSWKNKIIEIIECKKCILITWFNLLKNQSLYHPSSDDHTAHTFGGTCLNTTLVGRWLRAPRFPPLISPGINHTLPVPRGERDESGGELEIMLMSWQVSPLLWPFQKLLILLVVSGLEIITSSNPCNTAWPAVEPGQFEAGEAE